MEPASSKRPYLIRAMHEWMTDNDMTPHIVVDATADGVRVPQQHVSDGRIILNVSYSATKDLALGDDILFFETRFGGATHRVDVPVSAILGIYAQETGQGMIFTDDDSPPPTSDEPDDNGSPGRPTLKVVK